MSHRVLFAWSGGSLRRVISCFALVLATATPLTAVVFKSLEIPTPASDPRGIASDPFGDIWFTEFEGNKIGRVRRSDGLITEFPLPILHSGPASIISVPTGTTREHWFTEFRGDKIGRISREGAITEYSLPTTPAGPRGIVENADGGLWFTQFEGNRIGRITRAGAITEFAIPTPASGPSGITVAWDHSLWFTEFHANKIGRISINGVVTEFPLPTPDSGPLEIATGSDGNLWFTQSRANKIGRVTPSGVITEFALPSPDRSPWGITNAPDGAVWFTERSGNRLGRLTTDGELKEFSLPITNSLPAGITTGNLDRRIWFTAGGVNRIGSVTRERLVIIGAGRIGTWETEFDFANPERHAETVWIGSFPEAPTVCGICPGRLLTLPADGNGRTAISAEPHTVYIDPFGMEPPTIAARVSNRDRPSQVMQLPVVRMSTLESLNPSILTFPSATRGSGEHCNLVMAEVGGSGDVAVRIEAFSANGDALGSLDLFLRAGSSLFMIDVLNRLGINLLDQGQIRVTKTAGNGLMWGLLATVYDDGRVSVSVGANP